MISWVMTFPICAAISWATAMLTRGIPAEIQLGMVGSDAAIVAGVVLRAREDTRARRARKLAPMPKLEGTGEPPMRFRSASHFVT